MLVVIIVAFYFNIENVFNIFHHLFTRTIMLFTVVGNPSIAHIPMFSFVSGAFVPFFEIFARLKTFEAHPRVFFNQLLQAVYPFNKTRAFSLRIRYGLWVIAPTLVFLVTVPFIELLAAHDLSNVVTFIVQGEMNFADFLLSALVVALLH